MSDIVDKVGFECYQMDNGVWIKERPDGRRGLCVADEAVLWQALQAVLGGKPQPAVDVAELVRENERLSAAYEQLLADRDALQADWVELCKEAEELRANQRKRPGRPRKDAGPAGGPEALAAPEQDPLDEDL